MLKSSFFLFLILCLPAALSGQMNVVGTTTSLTVNGAAEQAGVITAVAYVTALGRPVTAGRVTFTLNGAPMASVQVVGLAPARPGATGTASLHVPLLKGSYSIAAHFTGTSGWASSVSSAIKTEVKGSSGASLLLNSSGNGAQYLLRTRERLSAGQGSVSLQNVSKATAVGTVPLGPSVGLQTTVRDAVLPSRGDGIATADLSASGRHDVAITNAAAGTLSIFMEQSDESWALTQTLAVGAQPTAIVIDDFNGDGLADIAVANSGGGTVSVLMQDPSHPGFFTLSSTLNVGEMPVAIATADFDHDGLPDLVTADFESNTLSVLINNAQDPGQYTRVTSLPTQSGPSALAVGAFFGDVCCDLAVANYLDGTVSLFRNVSSSELLTANPTVFRTGAGPIALLTGDLNGDGLLDLATANSLDGTVSVLIASPTQRGQFPRAWIVDGFGRPSGIASIAGPDLVGPPDLIVTDSVRGTITMLHNGGDASFVKRSLYGVGQSTTLPITLYALSSGAFAVGALDASLQCLHILETHWDSSGLLSSNGLAPSTVAQIFQAEYSPDSSGTGTVTSNELHIEGKGLSAQTINFNPPSSFTYGAPALSLVASASSGLPVQFSILRGEATLSGTLLTASRAGAVVVQAYQPGNQEFLAASPVERYILVTKAPVTINVNSAVRLQGDVNPLFSGQVQGLLPSDSVHVIYASSADADTPPGIYTSAPLAITGLLEDSLSAENYQVVSKPGTLTICPNGQIDTTALLTGVCNQVKSVVVNSTPNPGLPSTVGLGGSEPPAGTEEPTSSGEPSSSGAISSPTTSTAGSGQPAPPANGGQITSTQPPSVPTTAPPSSGTTTNDGGTSASNGTHPASPPSPQQPPTSTESSLPQAPHVPAPSVPNGVLPGHGEHPVSEPTNSAPTETKSSGSSGSTVVPLPIPLPIPGFPGVPSLPHIGVNLSSHLHAGTLVGHRRSSLKLAATETRPSSPLQGITLTLQCPTSHQGPAVVMLSDEHGTVAQFRLVPGKLFRAVVLRRRSPAVLSARFSGDRSCPNAESEELKLPVVTATDAVVKSLASFFGDITVEPSVEKQAEVSGEQPCGESEQKHDAWCLAGGLLCRFDAGRLFHDGLDMLF